MDESRIEIPYISPEFVRDAFVLTGCVDSTDLKETPQQMSRPSYTTEVHIKELQLARIFHQVIELEANKRVTVIE